MNNAGIYLVKAWDQLTAADFDQTIAVNTRAQFLLSQLFAKALIAQQLPGSIVNMSSVTGQNGSHDIAYGASKGAVLAMTKSLAKALAPHNIRVNAVAPGPIWPRAFQPNGWQVTWPVSPCTASALLQKWPKRLPF